MSLDDLIITSFCWIDDVRDAESVRTVAARLASKFPALNVSINNADIMSGARQPIGQSDASAEKYGNNNKEVLK